MTSGTSSNTIVGPIKPYQNTDWLDGALKHCWGLNIARNVKRWRKTTLNRIPKYQALYAVGGKHWDVWKVGMA